MKFLTGFAILAIITSVVSGNIIPNTEKPFQCHYFNKQSIDDDSPCTELDENGHCNRTQTCTGPEDNHCYSSWEVIDGKVSIKMQGCWISTGALCSNNTCTAGNNTDNKGLYFCCCNEPMCNRDVILVDGVFVEEGDDGVVECGGVPTITKVIIVILVLLVLSAVIVASYYLYQTKRKNRHNVDQLSLVSPQTGITQCSNDFKATEFTLPELIDLKAQGRFGSVWKATYNGNIVAVKTFEPNVKSSWQTEKDIFNTPLLQNNSNILRFIGTATQGSGLHEQFWLITEFHEHGSLTDYLKSNIVSVDEALNIMQTMAAGLSFLHEDVSTANKEIYKPSIAHRDFKSKNVLLDHNLNAVLADFGLAVKFMPNESPGESHGQVGTTRYMAPEVLEGAIAFQRDAFLRIDIYAFALVMWEITMRCKIEDEVEVGKYFQPFEIELGPRPSLEIMTEHVVDKKMRPEIFELWRNSESFKLVCETMDECWDHDAEARLSAGCVEMRIAGVRRNRKLTRNISDSHDGGHGGGITASTEIMNQRNLDMQNMDDERRKKIVEEGTLPTNGSVSSGYHSHALPNTPTHHSLSMESSESRSCDQEPDEAESLLPDVTMATREDVMKHIVMS